MVFQYRLQSNIFENCSIENNNETPIIGGLYSIVDTSLIKAGDFINPSHFVLIDNKFLKSDTGNVELRPFVFFEKMSNLSNKRNKFQELIGSIPALLAIESLHPRASVLISENTISTVSGPGFVRLASQEVNEFTFCGNKLLGSLLNSSFLFYSVTKQVENSTMNFTDNYIYNNSYSHDLIKISTENSNYMLIFQNLTVKDLKLNKLNHEAQEIPDSSAIILASSKSAEFILANSSIEIAEMTSNMVAISVSANKTKIINSSVLLSGDYAIDNVIISSKEVVFENNSFLNDVVFDNSENSAIAIFKKRSDQEISRISLIDNRFNVSSRSSGQLLQVYSYKTSLWTTEITLQNNSFELRANNNICSWIRFKMIKFQRSEISNNNITVIDKPSAGSWVNFFNCSGELSISNNRVNLKRGDLVCI